MRRLGDLYSFDVLYPNEALFREGANGLLASEGHRGWSYLRLANKKGKKGGKSNQPKQKNRQQPGRGKKMKSSVKSMGRVMRNIGGAAVDGLLMSPCAAKYALAIANPWDPRAQGACIPSKPSRASQKATAFTRLTVSAAAGQSGYALFMPTLANNKSVVYYTDGVSRTNFETLTSVLGTGILAASMTNLPYNSSNLTDNGSAGSVPAVSGRMISFSATAQYIGTELTRSGLVYCFTDPAHENLANQSINDVLARAETDITPNGPRRDKCTMQISAISASELAYPDLTIAQTPDQQTLMACYPFSGANEINSTVTSVGACPMVFYFTNPSSAVMSYHVEIVAHVEYVGELCEGKTTPNVADDDGLNRVISAVDKAQAYKASRPGHSFGKLLKEALQEVAKETSIVALQAGKAMLMAALV